MKRLFLLSIFTLLSCLGIYAVNYGVTVRGVLITDSNHNDVLGDGGSVKASLYDNEMTITLNNASFVYNGLSLSITENSDADFVTLLVKGNNTFTATNNRGNIVTFKNLDIVGSGTLTLQGGSYAILSHNKDVTVATHLNIDAPAGFTSDGSGTLEFTSVSEVNIEPTTIGAITDFGQIRLSGVEMLQPTSYSIAGGSLKDKSGNIYKGAVKIGKNEPEPEPEVKYGVSIAGVEVTSKNCKGVLGVK